MLPGELRRRCHATCTFIHPRRWTRPGREMGRAARRTRRRHRALMNVHSHLCPPPPTCSAFEGERRVVPHLDCPPCHPCSSRHDMTRRAPLRTPRRRPRPGGQVEAVEGREGGGAPHDDGARGPHEPCIERRVVCFSPLHHLNDQK